MNSQPIQLHQVKYPSPLYLNQRHVFDILAIMENGFALLETVKTSDAHAEDSSRRVSGELGSANIFAFLGIKFGGEKRKGENDEKKTEATAEKIHTPNSLFARMRERLYDDGLIETHLKVAKSGSFVEFGATLSLNPLVEALQTMKQMIELANSASGFASVSNNPKGKASSTPDMKKVASFFGDFLKQIDGGTTSDLLGTALVETGQKLLITVEKQFLANPSMADLLDGDYKILGKVSKALHSEGSISLLRNTGLSKSGASLIATFQEAFKAIDKSQISIPEMAIEISAPALQIMPIAIFL